MTTIHYQSRNQRIRFLCPICRVPSLCDVRYLNDQVSDNTHTYFLVCRACGRGSVWKQFDWVNNYNYKLKLVDPIQPNGPAPVSDMPDDVKGDYEEARQIVDLSPRSAAALLRLALQKLCRHLGEPGQNLDDAIRSLARKPEFGERLIRAADTLRITGNNAVHPGEMNEEDIDSVSAGLFGLLNLIVTAGITEPNKWDAMYEALPEKPRKAAEKKDGRG